MAYCLRRLGPDRAGKVSGLLVQGATIVVRLTGIDLLAVTPSGYQEVRQSSSELFILKISLILVMQVSFVKVLVYLSPPVL